MFFKKNFLFQKSFTVLEVIIAIFIITTGIIGVFNLVNQTISVARVSSQNLVAAYLAQEGIEIVRNIRDTNWIQFEAAVPPEISPWNDGLALGDFQADYTTVTFADTADFELCGDTGYNCEPYDADDFLNIDTAGFYNYTAGTPTNFKRKITISEGPVLNNSLTITVEVFWEEKGELRSIEPIYENLYNWWKNP